MANPFAGEVALVVNGQRHICKLTLGALAELEASLDAGGLMALIERFDQRGFSALDVLSVVHAGLRGGGWQGTRDDLLTAEIEGGAVAAGTLAAQLLTLAFAAPQDAA